MAKNNAKMIDPQLYIQAGIDPKTGLPLKYGERCDLKREVRAAIKIVDEQDAVNSFKWYNLPSGLDGNLIERILYYRGQGMFFYIPELERFYFLPYALNGTIDVYGRFVSVSPVPFNGTSDFKRTPTQDEISKATKDTILSGIVRVCSYEVELEGGDKYKTNCVILHDYSKQISQTIIPREMIQQPIIDCMSECVPYMNTALLLGTGISGLRIADQNQQANVMESVKAFKRAALNGEPWVPVISNFETQQITNQAVSKSEEYLLAMQSLDNLRLSFHGAKNGGLFQKKAHMLGAEQEMNESNASRVLDDRLYQRQRFCDIVNSIWNLGIYCEPAETTIEVDRNLDGQMLDEQDQSGLMQGEQPKGELIDAAV